MNVKNFLKCMAVVLLVQIGWAIICYFVIPDKGVRYMVAIPLAMGMALWTQARWQIDRREEKNG